MKTIKTTKRRKLNHLNLDDLTLLKKQLESKRQKDSKVYKHIKRKILNIKDAELKASIPLGSQDKKKKCRPKKKVTAVK
jgi:hypothetical protein